MHSAGKHFTMTIPGCFWKRAAWPGTVSRGGLAGSESEDGYGHQPDPSRRTETDIGRIRVGGRRRTSAGSESEDGYEQRPDPSRT